MIATAIAFFFRNLPIFLLAFALVFGTLGRSRSGMAERLLGWVLLLPIGIASLWAGLAHIAFPRMVAAYIGWQVSPFQFEVGMANLAIGGTACLAFWRGWEFRAAAVGTAAIFLLGDAAGHIHQMIAAGNFAPGNAGLPFYMDILCPLLAIVLLIATRPDESRKA